MKLSKEQILALKISGVLCVLLFMSFSVLVYGNHMLSLAREKQIFIENLRTVPGSFVKQLVYGTKHNIQKKGRISRNKIFSGIFSNFHITIGNDFVTKGFFDNLDMLKIISDIKNNNSPSVFSIDGEKVLIYGVYHNGMSIIVGKNIGYIYEGLQRLIFIAFLLDGLLLFIIYFISLKLAYITTKSDRKAYKLLEEYNYNVAHELKTPLSIIQSDLELLILGKHIDKKYLSSSMEELTVMRNIIDSLLFLTYGKSEEDFAIIDMGRICSSVIDSYFYGYKALFCLSGIGNMNIHGNEKLLRILIKNLLDNALKYGTNTSENTIDIVSNNNVLIISNHIGGVLENKFSQKNFDTSKLFDSFYQGDSSRQNEGYGLGLNIVKKIITLHKSDINICIHKKTFIITLTFKVNLS